MRTNAVRQTECMDVMTTQENHQGETNGFNTIPMIIAEACDIPREKITRERHAIKDLGLIAAKDA